MKLSSSIGGIRLFADWYARIKTSIWYSGFLCFEFCRYCFEMNPVFVPEKSVTFLIQHEQQECMTILNCCMFSVEFHTHRFSALSCGQDHCSVWSWLSIVGPAETLLWLQRYVVSTFTASGVLKSTCAVKSSWSSSMTSYFDLCLPSRNSHSPSSAKSMRFDGWHSVKIRQYRQSTLPPKMICWCSEFLSHLRDLNSGGLDPRPLLYTSKLLFFAGCSDS